MKLLFGYTLDYIKRNRRGSLAIMVAILMTATMMSALSGFLYNVQMDSIRYILREIGNWHGELFDATKGSDLATIETFDSIESTMIKGDWKVAQIDDPRRAYLVWRDANTQYWNSMPEGGVAILEGRVPAQAGEIGLSKQYFEHHPELRLGDSITLPMGNRTLSDGSLVAPPNIKQAGEEFVQTGTVTLTVVAKLDVATSSTVPAYTALGYLDSAAIQPEDDLTVYFRFHNIRDTYTELPGIAEAVGYQQDEYGQYLLRYNTHYLNRMGVIPPSDINLMTLLLASQSALTFILIGLMVVLLFVLVIHNAFVLSSSARLTQLGIFASIGATPKQIKHSVVLESLLLTVIPLPLGLLLGQLAVGGFIQYSNQLGEPSGKEFMQFSIGWLSMLPAILLTLLTIWWSALIPARRIAHMSPIDAIRQGGAEKLTKQGRFSIANLGTLFGLPGQLAANALQARKKSYRTATVSLTLSFLVLASFLCINSASTASKAVYQTDQTYWAQQDILTTLYNVATPKDFDVIRSQIESIDGVTSAVWYNTLRTVAWTAEDKFSAEFEQKGGFSAAQKYMSDAALPLLRDGQRRVGMTILGLDDATFLAYCTTLGIDPAPFYQEDAWRSILYHTVTEISTSTKRTPVQVPLLDIRPGDTMALTETTIDSYDGDFTFDIQIAAIADQMPPIGSATFNTRYSGIQIIPLEQVRKLATHFSRSNIARVNGVLCVADSNLITPTRTAIDKLCDSYFGSGDYDLFDEDEDHKSDVAGQATTSMMFGFVTGLLAIIGLSNSWSTVRGTLNARRREFAMLRSVGLPPKGLKKMLLLEAVMLGLTPMLLSLPAMIVLQGVFLHINEVSFTQWLPHAPWVWVCLYVVAVLTVTVVAYAISCEKLLDENIIEAIKVDSI